MRLFPSHIVTAVADGLDRLVEHLDVLAKGIADGDRRVSSAVTLARGIERLGAWHERSTRRPEYAAAWAASRASTFRCPDVPPRAAAAVARLPVAAPDRQIALLPSLSWADLFGADNDLSQAIDRLLTIVSISGDPLDDAVGEIERFDLSAEDAWTLSATAAAVVSRAAEYQDAEPDALFYYTGPCDGVMRPFCRQWIGRVLAYRDLRSLQGGQLPMPWLTGGGWECRHQWNRLSALSADGCLRDSGERMDHIREALRDVCAPAQPDVPISRLGRLTLSEARRAERFSRRFPPERNGNGLV